MIFFRRVIEVWIIDELISAFRSNFSGIGYTALFTVFLAWVIYTNSKQEKGSRSVYKNNERKKEAIFK